MNQYSQLLYFLRELAESNPLVNTVTKGLAADIDLQKANIFPLVHITIDEAQFVNGQTIGFNVTLECLNERNLNKKVVDNKFWRQDNEVDNHNETLAILNYMWTSIFRDWNENNMTTSDEPTLNKIEFAKGNILDGWSMSFQVEVPNTALTLCAITFDDIEATISTTTGGTVINEGIEAIGTFALTYGSNNAYYAQVETGYRFVRWLYNSVQSLINPIAIKAIQSHTLVAEFIKQWQLTTSVVGEGTISPASGIYDEGATVEFTAEPNDPETTELDRVEIIDSEGTIIVDESPFNVVFDRAKEIVGYFTQIFNTIQDIFSTPPVRIGNNHYFQNALVNNSKPFQIIGAGNSIMAGIGSCDITKDVIHTLADNLNGLNEYNYEYVNTGVPSRNGAEMITAYPKEVRPFYKPDVVNIVIFFEFVNSIAPPNNKTSQEVYDEMTTYAALIEADRVLLGYDIVSVFMTAPAAPINTIWNITLKAANVLARTTPIGDYQFDLESVLGDTEMNDLAISCDKLHLTQNGLDTIFEPFIRAQLISNIIPSYIESYNCQILNQQVIKFDGVVGNYGVTPNISLPDRCTITIIYNESDYITGTAGILPRNNGNPVLYRLAITRISTTQIRLFWGNQSTFITDTYSHTKDNNWHKLVMNIDFIDKWFNLKIDNVVIRQEPIDLTGLIPSDNLPISLGRELDHPSYYDAIKYHQIRINDSITDNGNDIINLIGNAGNGAVMFDWSGNNLHAQLYGAADKWTDFANVPPEQYNLGCSLWVNGASYIIAPIGVIVTETGYVKVNDFPAGSGILKGLLNTYLGILNNPTVEQDYDTLNAIPESEIFVPTKTENSISRLLIKE